MASKRTIVVYLATAGLATLASPVVAQLAFTDVMVPAGLDAVDGTIESAGWGDYDNDGDQDVYWTGSTSFLFRNNGDGTFTDVTDESGAETPGFSVGCAWGDLDNDGDLDLYVVVFDGDEDALYENNGDGTFTNISVAAGINELTSSRGVALLDYDQDSLLDIFVNASGPDILYHNLGNMTFENVAPALGVDAIGEGVGCVASDVDNNGYLDIWSANRSGDPNPLYLNNGDGTFTDVTRSAGIDKVGFGMGVIAFDYDNDLDMDLYWTTWPGNVPEDPVENALYQNQGDGTLFIDVAGPAGVEDVQGWGISAAPGDVDNDGWEDMFVTNGFSILTTASVLFHNNGDGTFSDATDSIGPALFDWRGCSFADYDMDGDVDLAVTGAAGDASHLFRNDAVNNNHWVTFDLTGSCSNRSAIGARVTVTTDQRTTVKEVYGGVGRGGFNDLPLEFGLGDATQIQDVTIRWPNGLVQELGSVAMDQVVAVTEPLGSDFNQDGDSNILDFVAYQAAFAANEPAADCNDDDAFNILDFVCFQGVFANGCP